MVVQDGSATSYDLTLTQGGVRYTISMQTLSETELASAVTEEVLTTGNYDYPSLVTSGDDVCQSESGFDAMLTDCTYFVPIC